MSKNTFFMLLGGSIALWLGGILGLISYALIALVMLFAGYVYEALALFAKGFRDGLVPNTPRPEKKAPCLYVVK